MTSILSLGNLDQVIQISDRRLSANGRIIDDDSNKATCLVCRNGRFAIGYTGLATYGSFKTQDWLLNTLFDCAAPEYTIYEMIERFATKASQDFVQIPSLKMLPASYKRISIMLTGYLTHGTRPLVGNLIITNFQDFAAGLDYPEAKEKFWVFSELEKDDAFPETTLIQRVGAWQAMNSEDEFILRQLLQKRESPKVLIDKTVDLIRRMTDRPEAGGVIGKNLIAIVVPSNIDTLCTSIVKPDNQKDIFTFTDNLFLLGPEDSLSVKEAKLIVVDSPNKKLRDENIIPKKRRRRKSRK